MVDVSTSTNKICDSCRVRIEYAFKLRTEIIDSNELLIGPKPLMITKLKSVANTEFYRIINVADDSQEGVINDNIDIEFVEAENNADVEYLLEDISDAQTDATQVANESDRDTATGEETSEEASLGKWTKFKSTNDESTRKINSKDDINELDNQEQNDESDAVSFLLGNSHLLDKMQSNEDTKNKGRPHACKVCSKSFLRKSNLVDHLRLHANLRLYQCSHCDKSFVQAGNYKSHLRIHTKERPFQCTLCPKTYNQSSALKVKTFDISNNKLIKFTALIYLIQLNRCTFDHTPMNEIIYAIFAIKVLQTHPILASINVSMTPARSSIVIFVINNLHRKSIGRAICESIILQNHVIWIRQQHQQPPPKNLIKLKKMSQNSNLMGELLHHLNMYSLLLEAKKIV